jgi:DNA-binding CsgD family transcriptional regulator
LKNRFFAPMTFERLVDLVYEAAAEPALWAKAMDDLGRIVGAAGGIILTRRADAWVGWRCSSALEPGTDRYLTGPAARSQSTARLMTINHAGFIADQDAFGDPEEYLADAMMTEWGTPAGLHHGAATAIPVSTGDLVVVQVNRRIGEPQFGPEHIRLLDAVRPHLARAGLLAARWRFERLRAAAEALALIGFPALVLDAEGRVVAANSLIESTDSCIVWLSGNRVALIDRDANAMLQRALRLIADPSAASIRSFPAKIGNQTAMVAHLIPTVGVARDLFDGGYGIFVLTALAKPTAPDASLLKDLFDLTAAEIRVAKGVTEGAALAEIAERHGLSVGTIRSQVKSIFTKTGLKSQSQLAGLLAAQPKIQASEDCDQTSSRRETASRSAKRPRHWE